MLNADSLLPRPTLLNHRILASTVDRLGHDAGSRADVWHLLTQHYTVDLDAVAALLPRTDPEPHWLPSRR